MIEIQEGEGEKGELPCPSTVPIELLCPAKGKEKRQKTTSMEATTFVACDASLERRQKENPDESSIVDPAIECEQREAMHKLNPSKRRRGEREEKATYIEVGSMKNILRVKR